MPYVSVSFLFYFLPFSFLLYFLFPQKHKTTSLLISSFVFYALWQQFYAFLFIALILLSWFCCVLIYKYKNSKISKLVLALFCILMLACLGYFKYSAFFNETFGLKLEIAKLSIPLGISFFTIKALAFAIDTYKNKTNPNKPSSLFFQLGFFGGIFISCNAENNANKINVSDIAEGIKRILFGFAKKLLIADSLSALCAAFNSSSSKTFIFYWIFIIAFGLRLYFEFSALSDIAIGISRVFGYKFAENFNYPFISKSVSEFLERWFLPVTKIFKNSFGLFPKISNLFSALIAILGCVLFGLWHGANINFVLWGLFLGLLYVFENIIKSRLKIKLPAVLGHLYFIFIFIISFVLLSTANPTEALKYFEILFGFKNINFADTMSIFYLKSYLFIIIISIFASTSLPKKLYAKIKSINTIKKPLDIAELIAIPLLLAVITGFVIDNPPAFYVLSFF